MPDAVTIVPSHITIDDKGVARIGATRMKVVHVVREMMARGSSPKQLHEAFPDLTLAQIHAALSYYYDHKPELDSQIQRATKEADAILSGMEETPGRKKLRDLGLRP